MINNKYKDSFFIQLYEMRAILIVKSHILNAYSKCSTHYP